MIGIPLRLRIDLEKSAPSNTASKQRVRRVHTKQIPMRTMQLKPGKPTISHQPRSIDKLTNNSLNIRLRHLTWIRERNRTRNLIKTTISKLKRNRRGRDRLTKDTFSSSDTRRLTTRMASLNNGRCAVFLTGLGVDAKLVHESFILLLVAVFGWHGDVEWCSKMSYIYLDVSWLVFSIRIVNGLLGEMECMRLTGKNGAPSTLGPLVVALE